MRASSGGLAPAALALALGVSGCGGGPEVEARTFELANVEPREVIGLIEPYVYPNRERAPGRMSYNDNGITVRELPENLDRIAAVLAEYDRPQPSLRLRFQVIEADGFEGTDPAIAEVQGELEKLFRFDGYRLAASGVIQALEHQEFSQQLRGPAASYTIDGEILRLDRSESGASLAMRVRLWRGMGERPIETSVRIPVGETVVLGSGQGRTDGPTAILVVTPEVSE